MMRSLKKLAITLLLILFLVGTSSAWGSDPGKPTTHIRTQEAWDSKEGGETIATAIEIELPFYDTGATCDNISTLPYQMGVCTAGVIDISTYPGYWAKCGCGGGFELGECEKLL